MAARAHLQMRRRPSVRTPCGCYLRVSQCSGSGAQQGDQDAAQRRGRATRASSSGAIAPARRSGSGEDLCETSIEALACVVPQRSPRSDGPVDGAVDRHRSREKQPGVYFVRCFQTMYVRGAAAGACVRTCETGGFASPARSARQRRSRTSRERREGGDVRFTVAPSRVLKTRPRQQRGGEWRPRCDRNTINRLRRAWLVA